MTPRYSNTPVACPPWCVHHATAPGHHWHRGDVYDGDRLAGQVFRHDDGPLQPVAYGPRFLTDAELVDAVTRGGAE